jgi:hypothetical protein
VNAKDAREEDDTARLVGADVDGCELSRTKLIGRRKHVDTLRDAQSRDVRVIAEALRVKGNV